MGGGAVPGASPTTLDTRQEALASIARRRAVDHSVHGIWVITAAADGRRGPAKVIAVTDPENHASQAVCRRLGMTHVGRTTRYYDTTTELFERSPG